MLGIKIKRVKSGMNEQNSRKTKRVLSQKTGKAINKTGANFLLTHPVADKYLKITLLGALFSEITSSLNLLFAM